MQIPPLKIIIIIFKRIRELETQISGDKSCLSVVIQVKLFHWESLFLKKG